MSTCKNFEDILLTDYIDGELSQEKKREVEQHLLACSACRALATEIRENLLIPFEHVNRETVSKNVWLNIKERIEQENAPPQPIKNFLEKFVGSLLSPRLAPLLTSFVLIVLVGSVVFYNHQMNLRKDKEQREYLMSVLGAINTPSDTESDGSSTPLERYFL